MLNELPCSTSFFTRNQLATQSQPQPHYLTKLAEDHCFGLFRVTKVEVFVIFVVGRIVERNLFKVNLLVDRVDQLAI